MNVRIVLLVLFSLRSSQSCFAHTSRACLISSMHEVSVHSSTLSSPFHSTSSSLSSSISSSSCCPSTSTRLSSKIPCATSPRRWGQLTSPSPTHRQCVSGWTFDTSVEQVHLRCAGDRGLRPALGQPHPQTSFADDCRVALAFFAWTARGSCLNRPVLRPQLPSQSLTQSFSARRSRTLPHNCCTYGRVV